MATEMLQKELVLLLACLVSGVVAGCLYQLLQWLHGCVGSYVLQCLGELLFFLLAAVAVFWVFFRLGNGTVRYFGLLALAGGVRLSYRGHSALAGWKKRGLQKHRDGRKIEKTEPEERTDIRKRR